MLSDRSLLIVARGFAVATILVVAALFVTAGALVQAHRFEDIHGASAIVLHVTSGVLALALLVLALRRRIAWPAAAVAVALFAYSFVQAYLGKGFTLGIHIPGALAVAVASTWLVVYLFGRERVAQHEH